jgi:hypothetical protein
MFCRGQWEGVAPDDKDLTKYHEWMRDTGGQGAALQPAADVAAAGAGQGAAAEPAAHPVPAGVDAAAAAT